MQELRSELLSSSSPRPSSASQGWGSGQAGTLCGNLCPLHPESLLMRKKDKPKGKRGQEQDAMQAGKQPHVIPMAFCSPISQALRGQASSGPLTGQGQCPHCPSWPNSERSPMPPWPTPTV